MSSNLESSNSIHTSFFSFCFFFWLTTGKNNTIFKNRKNGVTLQSWTLWKVNITYICHKECFPFHGITNQTFYVRNYQKNQSHQRSGYMWKQRASNHSTSATPCKFPSYILQMTIRKALLKCKARQHQILPKWQVLHDWKRMQPHMSNGDRINSFSFDCK